MAALSLCATNGLAQNGQPHSLQADALFSNVNLTWKAPAENITLKWHDDSSYNGVDGRQNNPEGKAILYAGARFAPGDLLYYVGERVDSIFYFEYRNVGDVRVQVYEDGTLVRDQQVDVSGFTKNSWRKVALQSPYTIPEGKEVIFSVRFAHGYNQDFVANTDRSPVKGKGNIYSYDGKTWLSDAPGDFMITAVLHNEAKGEVQGYYVFDNGKALNEELLTETSYAIKDAADGQHTYTVTAHYADGSDIASTEAVKLTTAAATNQLAPAATFEGVADGLSGTLTWQAPLHVTDGKLTWSNQTFGNSIGGKAASSKVWIKQDFDANDLLAAQGAKITAVNAYLADAVTGVTLFVMKDGVVDYYEAQSDSVVSALNTSGWNKFTLAQPYALQTGSTYAYGLYYTHAKGLKPIGTDSGEAVESKGNSFSTSSSNSKDFAKSKPSWKTLAQGDIKGNFLLTADVEGVAEGAKPVSYDVLRDGVAIASNTTANDLDDEVTEPGIYTYTIVTNYEGKSAPVLTTQLTYAMPADYAAPTVLSYSVDESTDKFNLQWSSDAVELKHYGTATYKAGFDEDMTMLYGTKFSATELSQYAGYEIRSLKFGIAENVGDFKVEVINGKGERLCTKEYKSGEIETGALYSVTLDQPIAISGTEDLYLAYNATLPAGQSPIYLDGGPLVDGGAMVSLSDGKSWLKLATIASTYNDYNIVIAATAAPKKASSNAKAEEVELSRCNGLFVADQNALTISAEALRTAAAEGLGIVADKAADAVAKAPKKAATDKPKAKSYKVYCNNEVVEETTATEFNAVISDYGVFNYNVTTVFENGWESPASRTVSITNTVPQKAAAPYDLQGTLDNSTLKLTWKAATDGTLSYENQDSENNAFGTKNSGTREAYTGIRFTTDTLANFAGQKITHISFDLYSTDLYTASVFVMDGADIAYEQEVSVSDLVVGRNVVRLNTPYLISSVRELTVGYHCTYANGTTPHTMDKGPAKIPGYSDLISSSASDGYWYSMKTKFNYDCNFRISAILAKDDATVEAPARAPRKEAAAQTYKVYRDGTLLASGVADQAYDVLNAVSGSYTVTAVAEDGSETIASNAVVLKGVTGIEAVDGTASEVEAVYNLNGVQLPADGQAQTRGIYLVKTADGKVKKVAK